MLTNIPNNKEIIEHSGSWIEPLWLKEFKNRASERFNSMSWPSTQMEEYRRTDLTHLDFDTYRISGMNTQISPGLPENVKEYELFLQLSSHNNGATYLKKAIKSPVKVFNVHSIEASYENRVAAIFNHRLDKADNRLEVWNYATLHSAVVIVIPQNIMLQKPVFIDFSVANFTRLFCPNILIILEKNSTAEFILNYGDNGTNDVLVNTGSNLICDTGANCKMVQFQKTGPDTKFFDHSYALLKKYAKVKRVEINAGGSLVKTRYSIDLSENGSDAHLLGISLGKNTRHFDIGTIQRHNAMGTTSRCLYKSAVSNQARTIHQGLIHVEPEAQKTDAYLTSKNLLLSSTARADSTPALKIKAHDVRCSHGATTGPIDKNQLFYLQSRGIPENIACQLLIEGYFNDILCDIPQELSSQISKDLSNISME